MLEPKTFAFTAKWLALLAKRFHKIRGQRTREIEEIAADFGDPESLSKYYIEPYFQNVNPADMSARAPQIASQSAIFPQIERFLSGDVVEPGNGNQLFVLADAGMGKTSLLMMLKLAHLNKFWPPGYDCRLLKLGKDSLEKIEILNTGSKTVLLLDSLDEDPEAWQRIEARLAEILKATRNFFRVIITCRTQFFPSPDQNSKFALDRIRIAGFLCFFWYLAPFTRVQVGEYLTRRFTPNWRKRLAPVNQQKMERARHIVENMRSLSMRPMLLSRIEDLLKARGLAENPQPNEAAIYQCLVEAWLGREVSKWPERNQGPTPSQQDLLAACEELALFFQDREQRALPSEEIQGHLARFPHLRHLDGFDITGRSLLNKNSEGAFRFAHATVQEFLAIRKILTDPDCMIPRAFPLTSQMIHFWAGWIREYGLPKHNRWKMVWARAHLSGENRAHETLDLSNLDLSGINMQGWNLSGANLEKTNLSAADLREADLSRARMTKANLTGAKMADAQFPQGGHVHFTPIPGATFAMVWIPPGSFLMGSPPNEWGRGDDEKQHEVVLTRGFWLGETAVSQAQWAAVMGKNPSYFKGKDLPVEVVSWQDCHAFLKTLNAFEQGSPYRLSREAEWEYACRAGTTTSFHTGENLTTDQANFNGKYPHSQIYKGAFRKTTMPVKSFAPNPWGLYQMHGNVWEWCADWNGAYTVGSETDPVGPDSGSRRVVRGGSWANGASDCRSAGRYSLYPGERSSYVGLRLLRTST